MDQVSGSLDAVAFTVKNLAIKLQISEAMVWKLIAHGQLKPIKIGRRTLVPATEIEQLLIRGGASTMTPHLLEKRNHRLIVDS